MYFDVHHSGQFISHSVSGYTTPFGAETSKVRVLHARPILCLGSLMVELRCYIPLTGVRFSNKVPLLSLCNVNLVDGLVWNEEAARSNRAMETNFVGV